jgi:SAM-dependent methyltransferase
VIPSDRWENASAYDRYMGRWSRGLAREFVSWLQVAPSASWLEVGCGTGSLTTAICEHGNPASVLACDTAPDFVSYCRERLHFPSLTVVPAAPESLPAGATGHDAVVSSFVLNFLPGPVAALAQMREACVPGGCVGACVWDYSAGMEFLRIFWDAAVALRPEAAPLHEGSRFPLCNPDALHAAFAAAGLRSIEVAPLTVRTTFASFDDYWAPFLNGPGPAPTYVSSLSEADRQRLADRLRTVLSPSGDYPVPLRARAWAAKGLRPTGETPTRWASA